MKNNCAFTICTRSYIGLAKTLKESFLKFHENFDFIIFVVDYKDDINEDSIMDVKEFLKFSDTEYNCFAFKYNVTEFCTALKPYCFYELFKIYDNLVFYIDPDILFFSCMEEILNSIKNVFLTPHRVFINDFSDVAYERDILMSGIFNCGFVGFRNTDISIKINKWWIERLKTYCFFDPHRGLFTDQKWIDFLPSIINAEELFIIRHPGYNYAPWNYSERKCKQENGCFFITERKNEGKEYALRFVHFSGYKYRELLNDDYTHKTDKNLNYEDTQVLLNYYSDRLKSQKIDKWINYSYFYNFFENGYKINLLQRKLFSLIDTSKYENPFSCNKNSFYALLKKKHLLGKKNSDGEINKYKASGLTGKILFFQRVFKFCLKFLGTEKYMYMLKMFDYFGDKENQLFLIQ